MSLNYSRGIFLIKHFNLDDIYRFRIIEFHIARDQSILILKMARTLNQYKYIVLPDARGQY